MPPNHIPAPERSVAGTILNQVAAKHGLQRKELLGRSRKKHIVQARWEAMARLRQELDWSMPRIGKFMRKDHTSVLHALQEMGIK